MTSQKPIDPTLFNKLIKEPTQRGGRRAKKVIDTTIRTYTLFFTKMDRKQGVCENPDCEDPRRGSDSVIMVVNIRGKDMCRYCFLAGYGSEEDSGN